MVWACITSGCAHRPSNVDLGLRPEVQRRVDLLAQQSVITFEHELGSPPSAEYAAFDAVRDAAKMREYAALTRHGSPIVRAYVGVDIARRWPVYYAHLRPLFSDETDVMTRAACTGGLLPVAYLVTEALCGASHPRATAVLRDIAQGRGSGAPIARECLVRREQDELESLRGE